MHSTNALIKCRKMERTGMPRSKFLQLTCQTFWKPMEIEKKNYREQNAKPRKVTYLDTI